MSNFSSFSLVKWSLKSRKENPQKPTQLSSRSHPRHLVGKKDSTKDTIIDITSDSQVNSNFPNRWSQAIEAYYERVETTQEGIFAIQF